MHYAQAASQSWQALGVVGSSSKYPSDQIHSFEVFTISLVASWHDVQSEVVPPFQVAHQRLQADQTTTVLTSESYHPASQYHSLVPDTEAFKTQEVQFVCIAPLHVTQEGQHVAHATGSSKSES